MISVKRYMCLQASPKSEVKPYVFIAEDRKKKDYMTTRGIKMSEDQKGNRRKYCLKVRRAFRTAGSFNPVLREQSRVNGNTDTQ